MSLLLSRKQHFAHAFQYLIGQLLIYHTVLHDIVIIINFYKQRVCPVLFDSCLLSCRTFKLAKGM